MFLGSWGRDWFEVKVDIEGGREGVRRGLIVGGGLYRSENNSICLGSGTKWRTTL
jgi:hypothetical protein